MKRISARLAVKNFRGDGDTAVWAIVTEESATNGYETTRGAMGGARVYSSTFQPKISPKFSLGSNPVVFTSGSCFAREIEVALHEANISVVSWNPATGLSNELFHRYNTFSIQNDFKFALEDSYDTRLAMETPVGWIDYSSSGVAPTKDQLLENRRQTIDRHLNIKDASVFIVTLGLVEAWFDLETNTYLNVTPSEILASNLSRFECRITGYEENLRAVTDLVEYIRMRVNPDMKIILTVSPVPLNVTFSGLDIAQANTASKATLRTVAQAVADSDPLVDYFPSYEIVTLSDPRVAWLPDHRHVRREMVRHIVDTFKGAYLV